MILYKYSPGAGADSPEGTKFLCQQEHFVTSVICFSFKKIPLKSDFIHSFSWFYTSIALGQGETAPRGQSFNVTSVICCKFKKMSLKSILYNFFHDFIHVYSPGAGSIQPPSDQVLMSTGTCHFSHLLLVSNHRRQ